MYGCIACICLFDATVSIHGIEVEGETNVGCSVGCNVKTNVEISVEVSVQISVQMCSERKEDRLKRVSRWLQGGYICCLHEDASECSVTAMEQSGILGKCRDGRLHESMFNGLKRYLADVMGKW